MWSKCCNALTYVHDLDVATSQAWPCADEKFMGARARHFVATLSNRDAMLLSTLHAHRAHLKERLQTGVDI